MKPVKGLTISAISALRENIPERYTMNVKVDKYIYIV